MKNIVKILENLLKYPYRIGLASIFRKSFCSICKETCKISKPEQPHPKKRPLYLDMQSTCPVDPRVLDKMLPYLINKIGNPNSSHFHGWEAAEAVQAARGHVAALIGAEPAEIFFTSGATESNNLAVKGCLRFCPKEKDHFITVATEHKCVLETGKDLENEGFKLTILPVKQNGLIELQKLEKAITPRTALVSVMGVNNEIGVRQPINEIAALCVNKKVLFHTDCAQAAGKIPLDVRKHKISMMSISAHKMYGPKGVGALFINKDQPVNVSPLFSGGQQEGGLRSGTLPAPIIVGFGAACEIAKREMAKDHEWISYLSKRFLSCLNGSLTHVFRNGCNDPGSNFPGCLNLSFRGAKSSALLIALSDISISTGSACSADSLDTSHVLRALALKDDMCRSAIRFGIGRFTTVEEIDYAAKKCIEQVKKLREMSPLWEMVQEGVDLKTIIWSQH